MVWSKNGHISQFQFPMPVDLLPWLLHLLDNVWFCYLCTLHTIEVRDDWFNDYLVWDIGTILLHVWTIRSHGRMAEGATVLLPKHSHVVRL